MDPFPNPFAELWLMLPLFKEALQFSIHGYADLILHSVIKIIMPTFFPCKEMFLEHTCSSTHYFPQIWCGEGYSESEREIDSSWKYLLNSTHCWKPGFKFWTRTDLSTLFLQVNKMKICQNNYFLLNGFW